MALLPGPLFLQALHNDETWRSCVALVYVVFPQSPGFASGAEGTGEVALARRPLKMRAVCVCVITQKKIKKRRLTIPKCPIRLYSRIMQLGFENTLDHAPRWGNSIPRESERDVRNFLQLGSNPRPVVQSFQRSVRACLWLEGSLRKFKFGVY